MTAHFKRHNSSAVMQLVPESATHKNWTLSWLIEQNPNPPSDANDTAQRCHCLENPRSPPPPSHPRALASGNGYSSARDRAGTKLSVTGAGDDLTRCEPGAGAGAGLSLVAMDLPRPYVDHVPARSRSGCINPGRTAGQCHGTRSAAAGGVARQLD